MEMLDCCDADLYVEGDVVIDLSELIDHDLEGILDIMAERLTDSPLLMDINYSLVDILDEKSAVMRVRGDITNILETDMDEAAFHAVADKLRTYLTDDGNGADDLKEFEEALDTMSEAALSERYVAARIRHEEKQETAAGHEPSYLEGAEQADSKRYALLAWNDEYLDLYMVPFVPQNMTLEEAKEALAKGQRNVWWSWISSRMMRMQLRFSPNRQKRNTMMSATNCMSANTKQPFGTAAVSKKELKSWSSHSREEPWHGTFVGLVYGSGKFQGEVNLKVIKFIDEITNFPTGMGTPGNRSITCFLPVTVITLPACWKPLSADSYAGRRTEDISYGPTSRKDAHSMSFRKPALMISAAYSTITKCSGRFPTWAMRLSIICTMSRPSI